MQQLSLQPQLLLQLQLLHPQLQLQLLHPQWQPQQQLLPQELLPQELLPQQQAIRMTMMMSHRQEQLLFPLLKHMIVTSL